MSETVNMAPTGALPTRYRFPMGSGPRRPGWQWAAMLLGLVAWAVGAAVMSAAGLRPVWSMTVGFVVAIAVIAAGTLWLVPRSPARDR